MRIKFSKKSKNGHFLKNREDPPFGLFTSILGKCNKNTENLCPKKVQKNGQKWTFFSKSFSGKNTNILCPNLQKINFLGQKNEFRFCS